MNFLPDFHEHPGLLFVAATLLPLLSFLLILLASAAWAALRPHRDTPLVSALYNLFGGDRRGPTAAYVATGVIALAFVLCLIGFIEFHNRQTAFEAGVKEKEDAVRVLKINQSGAKAAKDREEIEEKIKAAEREKAELEEKRAEPWRGRAEWVRISPAGPPDGDRGTTLYLGYGIDYLNALMFLMVTFIGTLIHLFSIGYMAEEDQETVEDHEVHTADGHLRRRGRFGRFFMFLSLFCFSMLNLILADNLFQVFLSWELVGVCSYLLIGFYFERTSAANAANKAFITNRIGDAGFIIGLLILWTYCGTFNFEELFQQVRAPLHDANGPMQLGGQIVRGTPDTEAGLDGRRSLRIDPAGGDVVLFPRTIHPAEYHGVGPDRDDRVDVYPAPTEHQHSTIPYWLLVAAGLGVFLGCVGKSAQFPLQVWLPDAMEGPTPVSALIHAATMVAAGVYLVGRVYPLFTPEALLVIAYTGGITLFVAATIAVVMTDIKKVLAYSTVSQLGYMMLALGVGGWVAGLFHLLTHAFFKALLFLCSGSVIYGCHHVQEMTRMGGLFPKMKITAVTMLIGCLAIAGIPLFTGWYSKDAILAQGFGFAYVHREHVLLFFLPLATAGITTFYMARMWLMTFTGPPRDRHVYEHAHESPWTMWVPLCVLAACSIFVAWGWPIWNAKASLLEHTIHHAQPASVLAQFGHIPPVRGPEGDVLEAGEEWAYAKDVDVNERLIGYQYHEVAGGLALGLVGLGIVFAALIYYYRVLDAEEAKAQFPRLHAFLTDKWTFDRLYSVALVRPALVVAGWFRAFDLYVIDGILHFLGRLTVWVSKWDGRFDNAVVDGLVNVIGNTIYGAGARLRNVQTGFLRSYVLFLVLAAVGIFILLSYLVTMAAAR
jgi:NADH-quinone oxidoreductase subunit L